jgi:hypothetical protein
MYVRIVVMLVSLLSLTRAISAQSLCTRFAIQRPTAPSQSARFVFPIELAQGFQWGRSYPAPYSASLRLHPSMEIASRLQVGVSGAFSYTNPQCELFAGPRVLYKILVLDALPYIPAGSVDLFAEVLFGHRSNNYISGGLKLSLGKLFQLGTRVKEDIPFDSRSGGLEFFIGHDPTIFHSADRSDITITEIATTKSPERSFYTIVTTEVKKNLLASFQDNEALANLVITQFDQFTFSGSTLAELESYLLSPNVKLDVVVAQVDSALIKAKKITPVTDIRTIPDPIDGRQLLDAIFVGWCKALAEKN